MEDQEKYDRTAELRAFDETKVGVQGLVVSGCNKVPQMFIVPTQDRIQPVDPSNVGTEIPIINIGSGNRQEVVESVRVACEKWGFFQVVGHAVPQSVMDGILRVVRDFHEEGGHNGMKRRLYSRDPRKAVKYNSNFNLYESPVATWRDTLFCRIMSDQSVPDALPDCYKSVTIIIAAQCDLIHIYSSFLYNSKKGANTSRRPVANL
ncbi:hypothetical protein LUZ60_016208 [Juncus effusus]|nr:hypothetical protein LUZ60_016208 [Juncus effusus]